LPILSTILIISRMFFSLLPTSESKMLPMSSENNGQSNSFAIALQIRLFSVVILQAFYPIVLYLSFRYSSAYLFTPKGCLGLLGRLYLFTPYALRLVQLCCTFTSD
jgi:hypothetical protein